MPKYWALGVAMATLIGGTFVARAQTIPDEYSKRIAYRSEIGTLNGEFAGDHIDLGSGSLEIVQTDIDLPGNNALPVRVARLFKPADPYLGGHFGDWSLDIPDVHGTFNDVAGAGWEGESSTGAYTSDRCTWFGKPQSGFFFKYATFDADDYWFGTFFHLPGSGDQEMMNFWVGAHAPDDGYSYRAMTKAGAAARCVALATTSDSSVQGEGFEMVTPDGTIYTLNQMVKRPRGALRKGQGSLKRADFILYPTRVTDRFGNTVTYNWSTENPWHLTSIVASDGRRLDFTYESADSEKITSITDGSRTWRYAYAAATDYSETATDTVTLPDGRTWSLRLAALVHMPTGGGTTHCDGIGGITQRTGYDDGSGSDTSSGSITGPSGATVAITMARILLGRSHVDFNCGTDVPDADSTQARPENPYLFYSAAVVGKTITGPGLPSGGLHWSYSYGPTHNCWDGIDGFTNKELYGISCTDSPTTGRTVLVTAPDGVVNRYTFGNQANVDEGMLFKTQYGWDGTHSQRMVEIAYGSATAEPYGAFAGWSPRGNGDPALTSRNQPQRKITTSQQGQQFVWQVADTCGGMTYCFDEFARPTQVVRTGINTPAGAQTESIAYDDDRVHWVLGQVAQRVISGLVAEKITFDSSHRPSKVYAFGKLKSTFTYNTDGTIATVKDGGNKVTTYSSWKRGIPRSVQFADGTMRTAVVGDEGWIESTTDENGFATSYAYDTMGRITQMTYPAGDSVVWAPTTSTFAPVASAENGIAAGHWKQTVSTGNARKITLFDALWRPVLVREYDAADVSDTDHYVATAYDKAGRVADASYPLASAPTMTSDATWLLGSERPTGVRTSYDAIGRPTKVMQDSELGVLTTTTAYLDDFVRRVTDARGKVTTEHFMARETPGFDWPVKIEAPEGQVTLIGRDTFGKPTTITRGAGL